MAAEFVTESRTLGGRNARRWRYDCCGCSLREELRPLLPPCRVGQNEHPMAARTRFQPAKDQSSQALGRGRHRIATEGVGKIGGIEEDIAKRRNDPSKALVNSQTDCCNKLPIATMPNNWSGNRGQAVHTS